MHSLQIVFAAVLAVSAAQFFQTQRPQQYVRPTLPPSPPRPSPQSVVVSRVVNNDQTANIIRYDNEIYPDGSYKYA